MRMCTQMLLASAFLVLALILAPECAGAFAVEDTLHVACPQTPTVPLTGHFLLVDPVRDVIHVAEGAGGVIGALDPWTRQVVGCVELGVRIGQLALDAPDRRLYVLEWGPDRIIVLNADTYAVLDTLPTGPHGESFAVQPDTDKLYVSNYYHDQLVVVDALSGAILSTIPIFHPGEPAVSRRHNRIYIPGWGGMLWVMDGVEDVIEDSRYIYPGACEPRLSAYDEVRDRLYVSPFNCPFLSVFDGATLAELAAFLELPGYPYRILTDEASGRAYVTAESSLAVVGPDLTVTEVLTLDGCYLGDEAWHVPTGRLFVEGSVPGPAPELYTLVLGESQDVPDYREPERSPIIVGANPFFDRCPITYTITSPGSWSLSVYGIDGHLVRRLAHGTEAERAQVVWDGTDAQDRAVPAGAYYCRLRTSDRETSARVLRLR
jgi:hypothetical protein